MNDHTGWDVVHASVRGASHRSSGAPNQDAIAVTVGDPTVVAIADGHGSSQSARSHVGSSVAARLAVEMAAASSGDDITAEAFTGWLRVTATSIIDAWADEIDNHHRDHPLTQVELEQIPPGAQSLIDPRWLYGTTLITVVARPLMIGIFQIGDGDVIVRAVTGDVVRPLPIDDQLVAGETTSLCLPDAVRFVRTAVIDDVAQPVGFLLVATDGYGNAFADTSWPTDVGTDLSKHIRERGLGWVGARLGEWITESAEVGGDDVTVAVLARTDNEHANSMWPPPRADQRAGNPPRKDQSW